MSLTPRVGPVRLLQRLGLSCSTWAKSMAQSPSSSTWLNSIHHRGGYYRSAKNIVAATRKIVHGIRTEPPELYILGNSLRPLPPLRQRGVLESTFQKGATR